MPEQPKRLNGGRSRLLLDTHVTVAGLLWIGPPRRLIEFTVESMSVKLFSSPALIEELRQIIGNPKFGAQPFQ